MTLEQDFERLKKPINQPGLVNSDICEHMDTLRKYAKECQHITEFGVRDVVSSIAFLVDPHEKIMSYDNNPMPRTWEVLDQCKKEGINWEFKKGNTLDIVIEPTELLFIDTLHTYEQLLQELRLHGNKSSKYIIMHDTRLPALCRAIVDFIGENPHWRIKEHFTNCSGLTILERDK